MDFMKLFRNAHVSWKTSVLGIVAAVAFLSQSPDFAAYFDNNPETVGSIWSIVQGAGIALLGVMARDGDKSSESTGAHD